MDGHGQLLVIFFQPQKSTHVTCGDGSKPRKSTMCRMSSTTRRVDGAGAVCRWPKRRSAETVETIQKHLTLHAGFRV